MHMYHVCAGGLRGQRLELEEVGSCQVSAGNQTQVLWKSTQCFYPQSHLSSALSRILLLSHVPQYVAQSFQYLQNYDALIYIKQEL